MGVGVLHDFNTRFSVVGDNVSSDVWLAMRTINNDTVKSTLLDLVSPDEGHGSSPVVITNDLNTILM